MSPFSLILIQLKINNKIIYNLCFTFLFEIIKYLLTIFKYMVGTVIKIKINHANFTQTICKSVLH